MSTSRKNYYSENYVLLGKPYEQQEIIQCIVDEYKDKHSDFFEGERDSFVFELRYTEPFEKQFTELKRLQGLAAEYAGRRNEFKGYIIINLSSYLSHANDHYFKIILYFLLDMNDTWKYIFLIDNKNQKLANELVNKVLHFFVSDSIPCKVVEERKEKEKIKIVNSIFETKGINCSDDVKSLFVELLNHDFKEEVVSQLITSISWYSHKCINMELIDRLVSDSESIIRYILSQKELDELCSLVELRKEKEKHEEARS